MPINSKIICFEPSKINLDILSKHLYLNKKILKNKIILENCVVGESVSNKVQFYEDLKQSSGMNSIVKNKKNLIKTYKNQITLDQYCDENKISPDLIKIDVEGSELNVLKGAMNTILKNKPIIILSVHPNQLDNLGTSVFNLYNFIKLMRYEIKNANNNLVSKLGHSEYILTYND